jgi:hypothetical protein
MCTHHRCPGPALGQPAPRSFLQRVENRKRPQSPRCTLASAMVCGGGGWCGGAPLSKLTLPFVSGVMLRVPSMGVCLPCPLALRRFRVRRGRARGPPGFSHLGCCPGVCGHVGLWELFTHPPPLPLSPPASPLQDLAQGLQELQSTDTSTWDLAADKRVSANAHESGAGTLGVPPRCLGMEAWPSRSPPQLLPALS